MGINNAHPSGIVDERELAEVSITYWGKYYEPTLEAPLNEPWTSLLSFQQGWQACKEFYNIS